MPNKLEELKQFVAQLFDAATDKTIIEKSAVVNQNGIKLQSEDVVCVGTTMFQIVFLQ